MSTRTPSRSAEQSSSRPNYTRRRIVAGAVLAGAAVAGIAGIAHVKEGFDNRNTVEYTQDQYKEMPQMHITVQPGDGAEDVIRSVEPGILADPELRAEVIDYIQAQGANKDANGNPQLAQSQEVSVPAVPGMEVPQQGR